MTNAAYILAGYVGTAATIAAYAWSIRTRTRRVERLLPAHTLREHSLPEHVPPSDPPAPAATSNAATPGRDDTDREG